MEGKEIIANSDYSAYVVPLHSSSAIVTEKQQPSTTPIIKDYKSGSDIAEWGDGNNFPQLVIEDVRRDPEIGTLLNNKAELLYSGGLAWGKIEVTEDGKEVMRPLKGAAYTEIKTWLERSNIERYLFEAATDFYWFNNVFPEIVLDLGRKKIVQLCVQAAERCRWARQSKNGFVETCYISANWPDDSISSGEVKQLPVIDPYYDAAANLMRFSKGNNFIYPLSYPSPGSKYYELATWNSIRESGWLSVSQAVPKFKKSLLEKQLTIKYHIEVATKFWELKYPGFEALTKEGKEAIKQEELGKIQDLLSGVEKSGNSLFSPFISDPAMGKEYSLWKITAIDDKIKAGMFLEEGKDASLYKMSAIGLHPALIGTMPNNGMGGAGSNIREAYNLHMMKIKYHQHLILEPLNKLIKYFNGWDPEVEFRFKNDFMTTLDAGKETTAKTS